MSRVVIAVGIATVVVGVFLDRRGLGASDPDWSSEGPDLDALTATWTVVVVLAALLSLARRGNARAAAAVLGTLGLVGSGDAAMRAVASRLPGPSTDAAGGRALALAAPASTSSPLRGPSSSRRRRSTPAPWSVSAERYW